MACETKSSPLVTVMIPVFNGEKTIARALRSLLYQTYDKWNAIVVDDGSSDNTVDVVNKISDPRILIKHTRNKGRAAARQTALNAASGDYIAYLDADDFHHPEKLSRQIKYMLSNPDIVFSGCGVGSFKTGFGLLRVRADFSFSDKVHKFGKPIRISPISSIIKTDIAKSEAYLESLTYGEDMDYFQRVLDGKLCGAIPDVLHFYSEFDDVTARKMISAYFPIIKNHIFNLKTNKLLRVRSLLSCCSRMAAIAFICLFFGKDRVLLRRGRPALPEEKRVFAEILKTLEV